MKYHARFLALTMSALAAAGLITGGSPALAGAPRAAGPSVSGHVQPRVGKGTASMIRTADLAKLGNGSVSPSASSSLATRGRDGKPAGQALPVRKSVGTKVVALAGSNGANLTAGAPAVIRPFTAPTHIYKNFNGIKSSGSSCGGCQPPDVNAAVGPSNIMEAVNLHYQVYTKTGGKVCGGALSTFLGTTDSLSDPRVMYDNFNSRWILVMIPIPATSSTAPALYLATSQTSNPCGSWWVYRITFSGGSFPAGTLLDYPYLGQDRNAILSSSNNFAFSGSYSGSTAFGIPKSAAYAGAGFSFSAFGTAFSSAPMSVAGIPMAATSTSYFLASVPGTGYALYAMTNSAGPGTTYTLQANISSAFNAPSRRVNQPGVTQTLDPLDGRIVWAPVYDAGFVWFAHGIDIGGFPAVRYGAISTSANTATVASAYHSGTSDDFNPSIGVSPGSGGGDYIWVNWAYTDSPASVPTSTTVNGVLPGAGVPALTSGDLVLVTGTTTTSNFRFGDYSSVAIDPTAASGTCAAGKTATVAQQYFTGGNWATRIARVAFC